MWEFSIYGTIIAVMVLLLNVILLKKLTEAFGKRRLWLTAALCSVEAACYLIPYFAAGRIFYMQETAAGVLLFLFCFALIRKTKTDEGEEKPDGKQTGLLLVIPVTSMAALLCLFLGDLKPYFLSAICCGCLLAANLSVFYLYHVLTENHTHTRQRDLYRQQTAHYRNQLEVIEESQNRLRALRHDMKNHLLHLSAQLRQGHYEEALRYLEDMEAELQNPGEYVKTGNKEIDSLLNYKLQKARQVLSEVECRIHVPAERMPESFDINVILGNLLDNAIEAAQGSEKKRLKLTMRADRGVLFIHVANSYAGERQKKGKTFLTTKGNAQEHGVGLQNVRRMVERRNGSIEFTCKEGVFSAEVMLYRSEM